MLSDRVLVEMLDPSLLKDHLLESRDSRCRVGDSVTALDLPFIIWVS